MKARPARASTSRSTGRTLPDAALACVVRAFGAGLLHGGMRRAVVQMEVSVSPDSAARIAGVLPAQVMREDRILDEAQAMGDPRRLCDLFELSVGGTLRYTAAPQPP